MVDTRRSHEDRTLCIEFLGKAKGEGNEKGRRRGRERERERERESDGLERKEKRGERM